MSAPPSPSLDRRLGPLDAAAIVVSNVIGGGIFFVPILVAALISDARGHSVRRGLLGGALAFAGAMAYAELAALRPHAGGEYVYLRDAYGPAAGFLSGWTSFVAGFSGAIAASAIALADYTGRFVPAAADATPLLTVPLPLIPLVVSPQDARRADRDRCADVRAHPRTQAGPRGAEWAGLDQGLGARGVRRARVQHRERRAVADRDSGHDRR